MKVYALVGKSGTGKSYKAMSLAYDRHIELIIDDGLLIYENKKLAGFSAKRESNKISAVKRALFMDQEHREDVREFIDGGKFNSILILGTSVKMVEQISKQLGFSEIDEMIFIDEISTEEEIEEARNQRIAHGKHIIPLPTVEVKKDFSGYFLDSIKSIIFGRNSNVKVDEKTVVRPTFSYMGKYTISNRTLVQIVQHSASEVSEIHSVNKVKIRKIEDGIILDLECTFSLGRKITEVAYDAQKRVKMHVEDMTHLHVFEVNIVAKSLHIKK